MTPMELPDELSPREKIQSVEVWWPRMSPSSVVPFESRATFMYLDCIANNFSGTVHRSMP